MGMEVVAKYLKASDATSIIKNLAQKTNLVDIQVKKVLKFLGEVDKSFVNIEYEITKLLQNKFGKTQVSLASGDTIGINVVISCKEKLESKEQQEIEKILKHEHVSNSHVSDKMINFYMDIEVYVPVVHAIHSISG